MKVATTAVLVASLSLTAALSAQQVLERGKLTQDERNFVLNELLGGRHADLIRLWCRERLTTNPPVNDKAFLEYRLNQCLLLEGKQDEYTAGLEALAQRYPGYSESGNVQATLIRADLVKVLRQLSDARTQEADQRPPLIEAALRDFEALSTKIDAAIESARQTVEQQKADDGSAVADTRDMWEHLRLDALQLVARFLPEGSKERKDIYQRLKKHAQHFYDNRWVNFIYQCDATLWLAQATFALGDREGAAYLFEELTLAQPNVPPPYGPEVTNFIRKVRLGAIAAYARMWNDVGRPGKTLDLFEQIRSNPDPDIPFEVDPEPESVAPTRRTVQIEEAVALTAGGDDASKGERILRGLIARYTAPDFKLARPQEAEEGLLEVHLALARIVDIGVGTLGTELLYRAGLGYKSEGRYFEALSAFKRALAASVGVPSATEWGGLAYWEIAETNALMDRNMPAAVAYWGLLEDFGEKAPNAAKAATNALGYSIQYAEDYNGAWTEVEKTAQELFERFGTGVNAEQAVLQSALTAEEKGNFEQARRDYLKIHKQVKDGGEMVDVPFYYLARASAARCLVSIAAAENEPKKREEGIAELRSLLDESRSDPDGHAAVLFALGNALWQNGEGDAAAASEVLSGAKTLESDSEERRGALTLLVITLVHQNRLEDAYSAFDTYRSKFPEDANVIRCALELVEAYSNQETDEGFRRAAQVADFTMKHPKVKPEEQPVRFLLDMAIVMMRGGLSKQASDLLKVAQRLAADTDDEETKLALDYTRAETELDQGNFAKAVELLEGMVKTYPGIQSGASQDAPNVQLDLGRAYLGVYSKSPNADLLEKAHAAFEQAIGILDGRFRVTDNPSTSDLNTYWSGWYNLFQVKKTQNQCTEVVNEMKTWELMKRQIPEAWRTRFDELRRECEGR